MTLCEYWVKSGGFDRQVEGMTCLVWRLHTVKNRVGNTCVKNVLKECAQLDVRKIAREKECEINAKIVRKSQINGLKKHSEKMCVF